MENNWSLLNRGVVGMCRKEVIEWHVGERRMAVKLSQCLGQKNGYEVL